MMQTEFTRSEVETYLKVMKDDNDIVRFVDPLGANVLDVKGTATHATRCGANVYDAKTVRHSGRSVRKERRTSWNSFRDGLTGYVPVTWPLKEKTALRRSSRT